jgi:hypothetical protein
MSHGCVEIDGLMSPTHQNRGRGLVGRSENICNSHFRLHDEMMWSTRVAPPVTENIITIIFFSFLRHECERSNCKSRRPDP